MANINDTTQNVEPIQFHITAPINPHKSEPVYNSKREIIFWQNTEEYDDNRIQFKVVAAPEHIEIVKEKLNLDAVIQAAKDLKGEKVVWKDDLMIDLKRTGIAIFDDKQDSVETGNKAFFVCLRTPRPATASTTMTL
jgi:hypothetical protein